MDQTKARAADDVFVSYAQNREDVVLWRALQHVRSGTYVDVGAGHPRVDSVTAALYERGWSGVNVEPMPAYARLLREERPRDTTFECAASDHSGEAIFHAVPGTGLSTLDGAFVPVILENDFDIEKIVVELRRLDDLLVEAHLEPGSIHVLKVDVEGAEAEVLRGFDLQRWRPWVLVIESTLPMTTTQSFDRWEAHVNEAGYQFCLFDGLNRFYASPDHPELCDALSYPAGVFDEPVRPVRFLDELVALQQRTMHDMQAAQRAFDEVSATQAGRLAELEAEIDRLHHFVVEQEAVIARGQSTVDDLTAALSHSSARTSQLLGDAVKWRNEMMRMRVDLDRTRIELAQADQLSAARHAYITEVEQALRRTEDHLHAVVATVSWRVTRPLRGVRRVTRWRRSTPSHGTPVATPAAASPRRSAHEDRRAADLLAAQLRDRVDVVRSVLDDAPVSSSPSLADALVAFEAAADRSSERDTVKAWLACVAVAGAYPDDARLESVARRLRRFGSRALTQLLEEGLVAQIESTDVVTSPLEVVRGCTLIDVSHTATYDLHTGIQRVVRETTGRWLQRTTARIVQWNLSTNSVKQLSSAEADRFRHWRRYSHSSGSKITARAIEERSGATVIPWRCTFVLPELVDTTSRCAGYRALARSGVLRRFGVLGYDLIPMTASETVTDGMTANFGQYLALVKHSTHLSAISNAAADEFRAYGAMLASQGLTGPEVSADPLPSEVHAADAVDVEHVRAELELTSLPIVLVVGSHEPRKNHLVVLEAAERAWRAGHQFELVFAGGSSWGRTDFGSYVEELVQDGRPLRVFERLNEELLWGLYATATFSIFTSLIEGYGLPVAESLVSGTPAITSNYGSMAEIARGGGTVVVDPRSADELFAAIERLLTDEALRSKLGGEALARTWPTWDEYAASLWAHLVGDSVDDA